MLYEFDVNFQYVVIPINTCVLYGTIVCACVHVFVCCMDV